MLDGFACGGGGRLGVKQKLCMWKHYEDDWKVYMGSICDEDSFLSFVWHIQDLLPYWMGWIKKIRFSKLI